MSLKTCPSHARLWIIVATISMSLLAYSCFDCPLSVIAHCSVNIPKSQWIPEALRQSNLAFILLKLLNTCQRKTVYQKFKDALQT